MCSVQRRIPARRATTLAAIAGWFTTLVELFKLNWPETTGTRRFGRPRVPLFWGFCSCSQTSEGPYLSDLAARCIQIETMKKLWCWPVNHTLGSVAFFNNRNILSSLEAAVVSSLWTLSQWNIYASRFTPPPPFIISIKHISHQSTAQKRIHMVLHLFHPLAPTATFSLTFRKWAAPLLLPLMCF